MNQSISIPEPPQDDAAVQHTNLETLPSEDVIDSDDDEEEISLADYDAQDSEKLSNRVIMISARMRRWLLRTAEKDRSLFLGQDKEITPPWIKLRAIGIVPFTVREYERLCAERHCPERCMRVSGIRYSIETEMHMMKCSLIDAAEWTQSPISIDELKKIKETLDEYYPAKAKLGKVLVFPVGGRLEHELLDAAERASDALQKSCVILRLDSSHSLLQHILILHLIPYS
jgi:hypothetical protein